MAKIFTLTLKCPKCSFPIQAKIEERQHKFLLYVCPKCNSNVVYYKNKVDIISDDMVRYLQFRKNIIICGNSYFIDPRPKPTREAVINQDDLLNLSILLNTENDVEKIISQL